MIWFPTMSDCRTLAVARFRNFTGWRQQEQLSSPGWMAAVQLKQWLGNSVLQSGQKSVPDITSKLQFGQANHNFTPQLGHSSSSSPIG
jgi:uncharacterized protein (DUF1684 family)